jgi:hypothetical protein
MRTSNLACRAGTQNPLGSSRYRSAASLEVESPQMSNDAIRWSKRPATEDYTAALDYLSLIFATPQAKRLVGRLRNSRPIKRAAKDLLRASTLPVLPSEDAAVAKELKKIQKAKALSPILLVQGDSSRGAALIIADGYHRICAAYHEDESSEVVCLMAGR